MPLQGPPTAFTSSPTRNFWARASPSVGPAADFSASRNWPCAGTAANASRASSMEAWMFIRGTSTRQRARVRAPGRFTDWRSGAAGVKRSIVRAPRPCYTASLVPPWPARPLPPTRFSRKPQNAWSTAISSVNSNLETNSIRNWNSRWQAPKTANTPSAPPRWRSIQSCTARFCGSTANSCSSTWGTRAKDTFRETSGTRRSPRPRSATSSRCSSRNSRMASRRNSGG